MKNDKYMSEIIDAIESYRVSPVDDVETVPKTVCSSSGHTDDVRIREGNRIVAIFKKQADGWYISSISCTRCSNRQLYQREQGDGLTTAVVEGRLEATPPHVTDVDTQIVEPHVWEVSSVTAE